MQVQELKQVLSQGAPTGCYLFCGEEEYLKRHYRGLLRRAVIAEPAFADFNHQVFDGKEVSIGQLAEAVSSLPMMADQKLVEWNHAPLDTLKAADLEALVDLCRAVAEEHTGSVLLLSAPQSMFDPGTDRRPTAIFKKLAEVTSAVRFDKSTDSQLLSWISRHFAHEGLGADAAVCRTLLERCGHSMDDLAHEIDKVVAYVLWEGRRQVTAEDVTAVVSVNLESDAFGLSNALLAPDLSRALWDLEDLKRQRTDPMLVMGQVCRVFSELYTVSALSESGMSPDAIASHTKQNAYKVKLYVTAARKLGAPRIRAALESARRADLLLKRTRTDPWQVIEKVLIEYVRAGVQS